MTPEDIKFIEQLIAGSFLFTAGCYGFGFFILRALHRIERALTHEMGKQEGMELDKRVTRLERHCYKDD